MVATMALEKIEKMIESYLNDDIFLEYLYGIELIRCPSSQPASPLKMRRIEMNWNRRSTNSSNQKIFFGLSGVLKRERERRRGELSFSIFEFADCRYNVSTNLPSTLGFFLSLFY